MLAKPPLSISTMVNLMPSWIAVAISDDISRYEPSPTMTNTSRPGSARRTPIPPGSSYPMHE